MNLSPIKRQSLIQLSCTIAVTIFGFISTMIFTHVLGKDLVGIYFLFLTYVSIFNLIGDSGFGASTIKYVSEGKDQNELFSAFLFLRTILLIVSTLIFLTCFHLEELTPFILGALLFAYFSNIVIVGLSGKNHMGIVSLSSGLGELTRIIISIILVLLGCSLGGLLWGYIIGTISIIFYALKLKRLDYKLQKFTKQHIKSLTLFGLWILLINTAGTIMGYADTIFIGAFMETGDVAIYRVALSFSTGALFIANAIVSTLPPKISNWNATNQQHVISKVTSRSITYGLIIAIPIFIGALFLVKNLLYYCYGADFATGSTVCIILLFQQIVNVFLLFMGCAFSNSGYARQSFYGSFIAVIVNILLNFILIKPLGIEGVAIASLIAIIINAVIVYVQLNQKIPISFEWKQILHILIASIPIALICFIISPTTIPLLIITIIIGSGTYFLVLGIIDKGLREECLDTIKKIIK